MKTIIAFAPTDTGIAIGDLTWGWCKDYATDADISTIGCTLVEYGNGVYVLDNPNIIAGVIAVFYVYVTATPSKFYDGFFADDSLADVHGEPGKVAPGVTVSRGQKLDLLYKLAINSAKANKDTGVVQIYNNAGTVVDHQSTDTDDGTTFTKGKLGVGA